MTTSEIFTEQAGARLITDSRKYGKITLILKAFNKLNKNTKSSGFPIYIDFKLSLKLELLYRNSTNTAYWFNQWIMLKIANGVYQSLKNIVHSFSYSSSILKNTGVNNRKRTIK